MVNPHRRRQLSGRRITARTLAILCLTWVAGGSLSVQAGVEKGDVEVGADLGWAGFGSDLVRRDGSRFTLRLGYFLTRRFELEGDITCLGGKERLTADHTVFSLCTGSLSGVLNFFVEGDVVPYARLGVGQAQLDQNVQAGVYSVEDRSAALQMGAGSRFFVGRSKALAIRLDVSWLRVELFGDRSTQTSLAAGVAYRF